MLLGGRREEDSCREYKPKSVGYSDDGCRDVLQQTSKDLGMEASGWPEYAENNPESDRNEAFGHGTGKIEIYL